MLLEFLVFDKSFGVAKEDPAADGAQRRLVLSACVTVSEPFDLPHEAWMSHHAALDLTKTVVFQSRDLVDVSQLEHLEMDLALLCLDILCVASVNIASSIGCFAEEVVQRRRIAAFFLLSRERERVGVMKEPVNHSCVFGR